MTERCRECRHCTPRGDSPNLAWCSAYGVPVYTDGEMADCDRRQAPTLAQRRMEAYR